MLAKMIKMSVISCQTKFNYCIPRSNLFQNKILKKHNVSACRFYVQKTNDVTIIKDVDRFNNNDLTSMISRTFRLKCDGHGVFIFQPYIKWGAGKKHSTTIQLELSESVALVDSIHNWRVVGTELVPLLSFDKSKFFGKGKLIDLTDKIRGNEQVTAVFLNTDTLQPSQHEFLETEFGLPVYDRFLIIMQIFRERAISTEAKLQVAMAEIPYLRSRSLNVSSSSVMEIGGKVSQVSGFGVSMHSFKETRKLHLDTYEQKLKSSLQKLQSQREYSRDKRKKSEFPVIAVIGYTNSGKTSLIKALTSKEELQPKDKLFATLDVTFHEGKLPCNLKVLYVDTVGFISNIPTTLIEPFKVTLRDAMAADVILHIIDISHPNVKAQIEEVNNILDQLGIEQNLLDNIVTVANKIDLIDDIPDIKIPDNTILVSCANFTGISELKLKLEKQMLRETGRKMITIRVKTGGPEMNWLQKETAVTDVIADANNHNYSLMNVIITKNCLMKFKNTFILPNSKGVT